MSRIGLPPCNDARSRLSGARGGDADHSGRWLAGKLWAIPKNLASGCPLVANHPGLDLLLFSSPEVVGTQAWQENAISSLIDCAPDKSEDGRLRFARSPREEVYRHLVACIRRECPDIETGLCLEEQAMFPALDLQDSIGRCNCAL